MVRLLHLDGRPNQPALAGVNEKQACNLRDIVYVSQNASSVVLVLRTALAGVVRCGDSVYCR